MQTREEAAVVARLDLAYSIISNSERWVIPILVILIIAVVLLMFSALAIRARANARQRWLQRNHRRWEPLIMDFLFDEKSRHPLDSLISLRASMSETEQDAFGDFALEMLEQLRGKDGEKLRELLCSLGYEDRGLRRLRNLNSWKRAFAAYLLGALRCRLAVPGLIEATRDRRHVVAYTAASSLLKIGSPSGIEAVAESLASRDDWSEGQIKELLSEEGTALAPFLDRLLQGGRLSAKRMKSVVEIIGTLHHLPSGPRLLRLLEKNPSIELRISLIRSLGKLELPEAFPELLKGLDDTHWVIRSQSAGALGRLGDAGSIPALSRLLEDPNYWVRYHSAVALQKLGPDGEVVLRRSAQGDGIASVLAQEILIGEIAA